MSALNVIGYPKMDVFLSFAGGVAAQHVLF
jgi:hypothetical protein